MASCCEMETDAEQTLMSLKEFQENFKLGSGETDKDGEVRERNGSVNKQSSLEMNQEKEHLVQFHKSFHLCLDGNQTSNSSSLPPVRAVPNSLTLPDQSLSRRKKQRRSKKPPRSKKFGDVYIMLGEELGRGTHSRVATCRHRATGKEFAVKVIPKSRDDVREKVLREVEILYLCRNNSEYNVHVCVLGAHMTGKTGLLNSRNVLNLVEFFEEDDKFSLVFDRMFGGHLLAHIQKKEKFTEREASQVVRDVTSALDFLHTNRIAHRDLKPDNILCENKDSVTPVRICDFDLSSMVSSNHTSSTTPLLTTPVGSAEYMAPEVVDTFLGEAFYYDKKCDLWSLGVILFMMLCGRPPFYGRCGKQCGWERGENCPTCQDMLLTRIRNGEYDLTDKDWAGVSEEAKDLLKGLLQTEVKQRLSAREVLNHPWVKQRPPETPLNTPEVLNMFHDVPSELSLVAASCMQYNRQLSSQMADTDAGHAHKTPSPRPSPRHPFALSPPGSSELAVRRHDGKRM